MLTDTHSHLQDPKFKSDLARVTARAREAGVARLINVGYDLPSSRAAISMAASDGGMWAAVGIHPHDAAGVSDSDIEELRRLGEGRRVVAIGEVGLDYYRDLSPRPDQRWLFRMQVAIANDLRKPLVIHTRDAFDETLQILEESVAPGVTVVMHCFAGDAAGARECLKRGYYLGIGGTLTYPKSDELRRVGADAPLERLLLETDCPYLPPQQFRGKRNEPAYVRLVCERLAELRGTSCEQLADATSANATRVFGLR